MRMQEPEQWQQSGQQSQTNQEYGEYRADYPGKYDSEQQQKIFPQEEQRLSVTFLGIFAIILSSLA